MSVFTSNCNKQQIAHKSTKNYTHYNKFLHVPARRRHLQEIQINTLKTKRICFI
jgi:hypothetical protein